MLLSCLSVKYMQCLAACPPMFQILFYRVRVSRELDGSCLYLRSLPRVSTRCRGRSTTVVRRSAMCCWHAQRVLRALFRTPLTFVCSVHGFSGRRLDLSKNGLNRLKGLQGCPQVQIELGIRPLNAYFEVHLLLYQLDSARTVLYLAHQV